MQKGYLCLEKILIMTTILDNILSQFGKISAACVADLTELVFEKELAKGEKLLDEGRICRNIYYVQQGGVRAFYYKDGKDIASWFSFEQDIAVAMYSFVSQKPSIESIEALETTVLIGISHDNLYKMYEKHPELNTIGRLLGEKYYIELEERLMSLQHQTAKERYAALIAEKPNLLQRATLGQIASYLGISQETLSRIRGNG
jgi:CRP/FNR family transcriptional regulator, anaerobic regulatory protein